MPNLLGKKFHLGSLKPAIPFSGCRPNLRKTAMKTYRQLTVLAAILHEHPADSVILIPETAAAALRPQTVGNLAALFAPTARFIVQAADAPLRLGYRQWLTVGALQRIRQNLPAAPSQADWLNILATYLIAPPAEPISNADIPPLAWAELADDEARIQWWMQCVRAYLNGGDFTPASRAALERNRHLAENAIAALTGQPAAAFSLPPARSLHDWQRALPAIPVDVPATLLLRRPDVAAAERAVAAANARIGVARAAWFPTLNLNASAGGSGATLADVISAPQLLWSLGLNLAQTLFDAGARSAAEKQAIAAHEQAAAAYRQRALTAMKEVQDQLATLQTLARQQRHAAASAENAAAIEQQMLNRYRAGLVAYTEVVTAQASALTARRSLMQLQLQRQQAAIALIQALGGGWQTPQQTPQQAPQ